MDRWRWLGAVAGVAALAVGVVLVGGVRAAPAMPRDDEELLHQAEYALTRACMEAQGFRLWTPPRDPIPEDRSFPYVLDDVAWARAHGYGSEFAAQRETVRAEDPNTRYLDGLAPRRRAAALEALNGPPDARGVEAELPGAGVIGVSAAGCTADARRALYGDLATWWGAEAVHAQLAPQRWSRVVGDPRWTAGVAAWSACMRAAGHPYDTPEQARVAALVEGGRQREVAIAVAEATCATDSGLAARAAALDAEHGEAVRREHADAVATRDRLRREALPRARAALQDH